MNTSAARPAPRRSVLVTGATGIVGSETYRWLAAEPDLDVTGTSARGDPGRDITAWRMGVDEPPPRLRREWDVIVHTAADTRWSMTAEEAVQANVRSVEALHQLAPRPDQLIYLSTAHVLGRRGSAESADLADYRNCYEWSKATAERFIRASYESPVIIRFPLVLGRRKDGMISRFAGFMKLLRAIASGMVPAMVGVPDAYLDMVPVDDIAARITQLVSSRPPGTGTTISLGRGGLAPTVDHVLDLFFASLNGWRAGRGVPALPRPPLLEPARWDRFFLPFARQQFSPVQLRVIDIFSEFRPYISIREPFPVTDLVDDVDEAMRNTVTFWSEHNPQAATAMPRAWS